MRDFLNWLLRCRQPNAHRSFVTQRIQPLQRQGQMHTALVIRHGMNLVYDHGLDIAQDRAALVGSQQNVERFGSRNQNVRRPLQHGPPLVRERVAGADRRANFRHQQPALPRQSEDLSQRHFKILLDVVAQRLQRRDVENFGAVRQISSQGLAHQSVNTSEERGQGLAGPGGSGNKGGMSGQNMWPALLLRFGRSAETLDKPLRN